MNEDAAAEEPTKPCRACRSPIHAEANKCVACGSAQDWTRFVALSSSVLALAVALVSVLTFALPIWKAQFYRPRPVPLVAFVGPIAEGPQLEMVGQRLTVANGGDAPMTLSSVVVRGVTINGKRRSASLGSPQLGAVILPNAIEKVETRQPDRSAIRAIDDGDVFNACELEAGVLGPNGKGHVAKLRLEAHWCDGVLGLGEGK